MTTTTANAVDRDGDSGVVVLMPDEVDDGLIDEHSERVKRLTDTPPVTERTVKAYKKTAAIYLKWCADEGYLRHSCWTFVLFLVKKFDGGNGFKFNYLVHFSSSCRHLYPDIYAPGEPGWDEVRDMLAWIRKMDTRPSKQAPALTDKIIDRIRLAWNLGKLKDWGVAALLVQWDGLLRMSEMLALEWSDIIVDPNGAGVMLIRKSKTDPKGEGSEQYLSRTTIMMLQRLAGDKPMSECEGRIFPYTRNTYRKHLIRLSKVTGLAAEGIVLTGHSARVGAAVALMEDGADIPALMQVGRWKTPKMVTVYTKRAAAGRSAMAEYHKKRGT